MKQLLTLGMAAALLVAACAAHAYPSLAGPTGLIQAPTAPVLACGMFDVAFDYVASQQKATSPLTGTSFDLEKDSWPVRAQYGVAKNFEIGAMYDADAFFGKGLWDVNAKYAIPYNCYGVSTAIGALYGTTGNVNGSDILAFLNDSNSFDVKATEVYLVGTDNVCIGCIPLGLNLDVNWAQLNEATKNNGWRVQFGANAALTKCINILADVQTTTKANQLGGNILPEKTLWSGGVRYAITPALGAEAGVTNGLIIANTKKADFFIGADYLFGCAAK